MAAALAVDTKELATMARPALEEETAPGCSEAAADQEREWAGSEVAEAAEAAVGSLEVTVSWAGAVDVVGVI